MISAADRAFLAEKKVLQSRFDFFLRLFFKQTYNYSYSFDNVYQKIIQEFQDVFDGKTKNLLILCPPRLGKTERAKFFCAFGFAANPASEFMYACSDVQLARDCSKEIREIVKSEKFQQYFGLEIRDDTAAAGLWKTTKKGAFWAGGFGSPIVGYGAGKHPAANPQKKFAGAIVCDDPLKEQDRHRFIERESVRKYFFDTLLSRKNDQEVVPVVVIMQPLHPEDLGQVIKRTQDNFRIVEFPACDADGNILLPEKFTQKSIDIIKSSTSNEMWQAKYMLNPISLGGNILKSTLLKEYEFMPPLRHRWIEADTAQKTEERHDYTVFQCWGKGYDVGIYLIDQFRKRLEYSDLKVAFKDFWNKHHSAACFDPRKYGYLTAAYIEDKSSGTQILQETKREGNIPVVAVPRSRSKFERATDILLPKLESGYIFVPKNAPFLLDLKEEMENFSGEEVNRQAMLKIDKKKTFDDQVDCLISACEHGFGQADGGSAATLFSNFRKIKHERKNSF